NDPEGDPSIHIQQVDHGKFAKISSTSLLLIVGAFGPALNAGSPVTGSVTSFVRWRRFLRGVSTIRPSSMLASSGSPARISRRRRSGPGRTTCPFVETLVCIVRRSYPYRGQFRNTGPTPHRRANDAAGAPPCPQAVASTRSERTGHR